MFYWLQSYKNIKYISEGKQLIKKCISIYKLINIYEYFTLYRKSCITYNIVLSIRLTNGTLCSIKSILFDTYWIWKICKDTNKKLSPDNIFTLNKRPTSINMELFTIYDNHFNIIQNNIKQIYTNNNLMNKNYKY